MNRKPLTIFIIIIRIILILLILYVIFFNSFSFKDLFSGNTVSMNNVSVNIDNNQTNKVVNNDTGNKVTIKIDKDQVKKDLAEVTKEDLKKMAGLFAERFGSYSNQSNYGNIEDLLIFMTEKMQLWAKKYVQEQKEKNSYLGIYYGITTKAVSSEIKSFDDDTGRAAILITTRRREATSTTSNTTKVFNQNILINFIKENGAWKVDSAYWQN